MATSVEATAASTSTPAESKSSAAVVHGVHLRDVDGKAVSISIGSDESLREGVVRSLRTRHAIDQLRYLRRSRALKAEDLDQHSFTTEASVEIHGVLVPVVLESLDTGRAIATKAAEAYRAHSAPTSLPTLATFLTTTASGTATSAAAGAASPAATPLKQQDHVHLTASAGVVAEAHAGERAEEEDEEEWKGLSLAALSTLLGEKDAKAAAAGGDEVATAIFNRFDTNKNGIIERAELLSVCDVLKIPAWRALKSLDTNKDGHISLQEFLLWFRRETGGGASLKRQGAKTALVEGAHHSAPKPRKPVTLASLSATLTGGAPLTREQAIKIFHLADANGNGYIDREELVPVCDAMGVPAWMALRDLDTDRDGVVSEAEFLQWWASRAQEEKPARLSRQSAKVGGSLTTDATATATATATKPAEVKSTSAPSTAASSSSSSSSSSTPAHRTIASLLTSGVHVSREQCVAIFNTFDSDRNGFIDQRELLHVCAAIGVRADRALRDLDTNRDGRISLQEFLDWQSGEVARATAAGASYDEDDVPVSSGSHASRPPSASGLRTSVTATRMLPTGATDTSASSTGSTGSGSGSDRATQLAEVHAAMRELTTNFEHLRTLLAKISAE